MQLHQSIQQFLGDPITMPAFPIQEFSDAQSHHQWPAHSMPIESWLPNYQILAQGYHPVLSIMIQQTVTQLSTCHKDI